MPVNVLVASNIPSRGGSPTGKAFKSIAGVPEVAGPLWLNLKPTMTGGGDIAKTNVCARRLCCTPGSHGE